MVIKVVKILFALHDNSYIVVIYYIKCIIIISICQVQYTYVLYLIPIKIKTFYSSQYQ